MEKPEEVVRWLGAVQAQDYPGAKWGVGLRISSGTDAIVERACDEGRILRTHVMRPTWHFVDPSDIKWMLALTHQRIRARSAYMRRQVKLDQETFTRSNRVIADALVGRSYLTRAELGQHLAKAGVPAKGVKLTYVVMEAELDAVICSGPRRGKQFTYALLKERAPRARELERPSALAELARRYFVSHGPATVKDFVWWSGLAVAEANAGIEAAGNALVSEGYEGKRHWSAAKEERAAQSPRALLLPTFDEMFVGYASFDVMRRGGHGKRWAFIHSSPLVLDGKVIGSWKRRFEKKRLVIDVALYSRLRGGGAEPVEAAAENYSKFVGMNADLKIAVLR